MRQVAYKKRPTINRKLQITKNNYNFFYCFVVRFFSDGRALMLISSIPPTNVVKKLKTSERAPFSTCIGHYQLSGNQLFLTLDAKYERTRENEHRRELSLCTMFERQRLENTPQKKTIYNMVGYNYRIYYII